MTRRSARYYYGPAASSILPCRSRISSSRMERWLDDHGNALVSVIGMVALVAAMFYLSVLWFGGVI